jgi:hypothetical protein
MPAIAGVLPSLDPEADAGQDYAKAENIGTEAAWDDFIANHASGHFHDLAVQRIAELSHAAPEKPTPVVPDNSKPVRLPDKSQDVTPRDSTAAPDKLATATPNKPAMALPSDQSAATPDLVAPPLNKTATVAREDSSPATPTKPAPTDVAEPTNTDGIFRRGLARALDRKFALALEDFDEVIRRDPKHAPAFNNRCWILALFDEVQAALEACDTSLRLVPNYADALDSRGLVNLKLGYYKKAIADYDAALSQLRGPERASAFYGRGIAKRRSGNAAGAKADIDIAKIYNAGIANQFASYGVQ